MKKSLILLAVLGLMAALSIGCTSEPTLSDDQAPPAGGPPAQTEHPPGLTDDVKSGGKGYN